MTPRSNAREQCTPYFYLPVSEKSGNVSDGTTVDGGLK